MEMGILLGEVSL